MKNLFKTFLAILAIAGASGAKAQVPNFSSYPSATAVIFLDFDGHRVDGTSWNYNGPIDCGPSGMDASKITEVFNRVAEDYRPFDVNVTTDSTVFLATPNNRRMRVIITISSSWYGSAGGVAFLNSFKWNDETPCFVFSGLLGYGVKSVSEAAAHEAGHTLGLYHQANYDENCIKISDYHSGVGTGEIGWAPIMGVGYYKNFTLWNNGPNSMGCNNLQSDLDVITTNNGFSYRTDDHTNTAGTSTLANFNSNQFSLNGVIERSTDQDLFKFIMPANGEFILNATPYNVGTGNAGSNLDMQVSLMKSDMTILNVYNPGTILSSVIDTSLDGGTYYLRIEGKGNAYAPSYASLGSYALQGSFESGGILPLHKLELKGLINGDNHKLNWEIVADEQITALVVEYSTDGRNFETLTQADNSSTNYMYRPIGNNTVYYRLNVTFDDNRQYYSNIIALRKLNNSVRPQLIGNLIGGSTIQVNSPGKMNYMLTDMNGRTMIRGELTTGMNSIDATKLINGLYIIRFIDTDEQWTEKLIRQ